MAVRKIAVSLPPELVEEIRQDAAFKGTTVSGWIADAAGRELRRKRLRQAIEAFEAENGVITDAELAEAEKTWPG